MSSLLVRLRLLRLLLGGLLAAALAAPARAGEGSVSIVRIDDGWRDAGSFRRISEYFSGRENTGGEIVLRTQPGQRGGYYFFVHLAGTGPATPVRLNLSVILPDNAKPAAYPFSTTLKDGKNLLQLGITGGDWPDSKTHPVAWKLEVAGDDGRVLATGQSYLWEPDARK